MQAGGRANERGKALGGSTALVPTDVSVMLGLILATEPCQAMCLSLVSSSRNEMI